MTEPPKSQPPPEWALLFARGAIRIGMLIPEIEKKLVARGLTPEEANSVVMRIVEGELAQEKGPWPKPVRLLLSAALGGDCLFLSYWIGGTLFVERSLFWVVPALGTIWIVELADTDSPWGAYLGVAGWIVLLLIFGYRSIFLAMFLLARFL
jgi:hypothetical protein